MSFLHIFEVIDQTIQDGLVIFQDFNDSVLLLDHSTQITTKFFHLIGVVESHKSSEYSFQKGEAHAGWTQSFQDPGNF